MDEKFFTQTKNYTASQKIWLFLFYDWFGHFDSEHGERIRGTLLGIHLFLAANRPIEECFYFLSLSSKSKIWYFRFTAIAFILYCLLLFLIHPSIIMAIAVLVFLVSMLFVISQLILPPKQYFVLRQHLAVLRQKDYYIYRHQMPTKIEVMKHEIIHGLYRINHFTASSPFSSNSPIIIENQRQLVSKEFENFTQTIANFSGLLNVFKAEKYLNAFKNLDFTQKGIAIYCLHSSGCISNAEKEKLIFLFNLEGESFQRALGNPRSQYKKTYKLDKNFNEISNFLSKDNEFLFSAITDLHKIWESISEENKGFFKKH